MRWVLGIFAVVGLLVVGFAVAVAGGVVDLGGFDPFRGLGATAVDQAATRPIVPAPTTSAPADDADRPTDSEASLAALKHPGYQDRTVYLSAADATVSGPKVRQEELSRGGDADDFRLRRTRRPGSAVDPKNKLPNALIRGWATPDDVAEWTFACPAAGRYAITFDCIAGVNSTAARGKGIAGGRLAITAKSAADAAAGVDPVPAGSDPTPTSAGGGATLTADVSADVSGGRWRSSTFHLIDAGVIELPAGTVTLTIRPAEKQAGLLSVRSVRLYPATE